MWDRNPVFFVEIKNNRAQNYFVFHSKKKGGDWAKKKSVYKKVWIRWKILLVVLVPANDGQSVIYSEFWKRSEERVDTSDESLFLWEFTGWLMSGGLYSIGAW